VKFVLSAALSLFACAAASPADAAHKAKTAPAKAKAGPPDAAAAQPAPAPPAPAKQEPARPEPAKPDAPVAGAPTAQQVADGIFAFYARQPAIRAAFTQVVTKKGLATGLKRDGLAWIKRGDGGAAGRMRWDYPAEEVFYFCNGDVLWSYERRERLAIKVPVKNSQIYQATTYLVGHGHLGQEFTLELVASPLPDAWALKLVPKGGTQLLRSLTLVVDKATFVVRASKLVDPIGDTTDLVWRDPKFEPVDDKVFEWSPPAGTTVKDLAKAPK